MDACNALNGSSMSSPTAIGVASMSSSPEYPVPYDEHSSTSSMAIFFATCVQFYVYYRNTCNSPQKLEQVCVPSLQDSCSVSPHPHTLASVLSIRHKTCANGRLNICQLFWDQLEGQICTAHSTLYEPYHFQTRCTLSSFFFQIEEFVSHFFCYSMPPGFQIYCLLREFDC